jgi:predicted TIM-barrel fold metal-dependent hydrolase
VLDEFASETRVVNAIDVHTHLHPPRLFAAIRRWFAERSDWGLDGQPSEPAEVAAELRRNGVERFVFFSYAHKTGMARELNRWLVDASQSLAGYGIPLGTVHLDDPSYREDLTLALDGGCAGIKVHEDVQRLAVDDARFEPAFAAIAERGGVVLAHVGPIPWDVRPNDGAARVERVLRRHPNLNVIVAHLGEPDTARYFELMSEHPRLRLDTTMALARASAARRAELAESFAAHARGVVYGTDYPNVPYPYATERDVIAAMPLAAAERARILRENAFELFAPFFGT